MLEKMMDSGISGYAYVLQMRKLHGDDKLVDALLADSKGCETVYLELKATVVPNDDGATSKGKAESIYWNVAKALISMINTKGGILIVGVDDGKNHDVVPLEDHDPKSILRSKGLHDYYLLMIRDHIEKGSWIDNKHKVEVVAQKKFWSQYLTPVFLKYRGHDIFAYLIKPCEEGDFIIVKQLDCQGKDGREILYVRSHGCCDMKTEASEIISYVQRWSSVDESLLAKLGDNRSKSDDEIASWGNEIQTFSKGDQSGIAHVPVKNSIAELDNREEREKKIKQLEGTRYEAKCVKAFGAFGFLAHPDFENGIFIHVSATKRQEITVGQTWRVSVGVRRNEKHNTWCYSATNAELMVQAGAGMREEVEERDWEKEKYTLEAIATEEGRKRVLKSLGLRTFEAVCVIGRGTCGGLSHSMFEGLIYIDKPVVPKGIEIVGGQRWQFHVKAHRMGPNGKWVYRAVDAQPLPDGDNAKEENIHQFEFTAVMLTDDVVRQDVERRLHGRRFSGKVTRAFLYYAFLSVPEFNVEIFCQRKKCEGVVDFVQGEVYEFCVEVRKNAKKGGWEYVATNMRHSSASAKTNNEKESVVLTESDGISIYIDETWPGAQDSRYKRVGVIGGVVTCRGAFSRKVLPEIQTHMPVDQAIQVIKQLLHTPEVLPFVFPITLREGENAQTKYFDLVRDAILVLLGWVIPYSEKMREVRIYLERFAGFGDGSQKTDFFKTLLSALDTLTVNKRFRCIRIQSVEWKGKNFEYIPYGDLVCKTCVQNDKNRNLANEVGVCRWDGYLPFSSDVLPVLRDMDTASPTGMADLLVAFGKNAKGTPLFKKLVRNAIVRAQAEQPFRDALLKRMEECLTAKNRDIVLLNQIVRPFLASFPVSVFEASPRLQYQRMLVEVQHFNHNGDPEAANTVTSQFERARRRLLEIDRGLCAELDLNRIVHYQDAFNFKGALRIADSWVSDSAFNGLPLLVRGKLMSSRGQVCAFLGNFTDAYEDFVKALSIFNKESQLCKDEINQTSIYLALNVLEVDTASAIRYAEAALSCPLLQFAKESSLRRAVPYREHLFLKTVWKALHDDVMERGLLCSIVNAYAAPVSMKDWNVEACHPYELIVFYRALLLTKVNLENAKEQMAKTEELFAQMEDFGGVIGLVHAYIRVTYKRLGFEGVTEDEFRKELDIVEGYLPEASGQISILRAAWYDTSVVVANVLPFNYK